MTPEQFNQLMSRLAAVESRLAAVDARMAALEAARGRVEYVPYPYYPYVPSTPVPSPHWYFPTGVIHCDTGCDNEFSVSYGSSQS